jgi:HAD superfamily hydrolase (TIGR01509 family)
MINAVIFDLDGTILDNEQDWEAAFLAVFDKHHLTLDYSFRQPNNWIHEPGLGLSSNWKRMVPEVAKAEQLARETWVTYHKNFKNQMSNIKMRDGVTELIEKIREKGWLVALSTGSIWTVVEPELEQLQLYLAFDVTTTGEEVMVSKPDPEIYTLTAQKLETDPEACLVIEDAIAGIRSAAEAGCKVVGLASGYAPENTMLAAGASFTVKNIDEIERLFVHFEH